MTSTAGATVLGHLFSTTSVPNAAAEHIIEDVAQNLDLWDGVDELELLFHRYLHAQDWGWPWFEQWREIFEEIGQFPRMYDEHSSRSRGKVIRKQGTYDHRATLLCHLARGLYYTYLRLQRSRRPGPSWCTISLVGDEPDLVEAIIKTEAQSYCDGLPRASLPPYFPGDRTMWSFTLGKRASASGFDCTYRGGHFFDR